MEWSMKLNSNERPKQGVYATTAILTLAVGVLAYSASEEAQHHRRNNRRWPWDDHQASGHRTRARGELTDRRDLTRDVRLMARRRGFFCALYFETARC
jgi:hypothetical protein